MTGLGSRVGCGMDWLQLKEHVSTFCSEKDRPVVVAFSGGVDSSVVALAAHRSLGSRAVAITAVTELVFAHERKRAESIVALMEFEHEALPLRVLSDNRVRMNGPDRCYWCKRSIFKELRKRFGKKAILLDGTNADDDEARPGMRAAAEFGVRSPLKECGIPKNGVREMAKQLGLPNHDLPSNSCIATRVREGQPLDRQVLAAVERLENHLVAQGVDDLRARVDELMMTIHYPSHHAEILQREQKNVQLLIAESVLEGVQLKEWQA